MTTTQPARNCRTCAHRHGDKCEVTGSHLEMQRRYPNTGCDARFSGWAPRQGLLARFRQLLWGVERAPAERVQAAPRTDYTPWYGDDPTQAGNRE